MDLVKALRKLALGHPDVEEGIACKGTALESSTFKVRKKAFLFLRTKDARLKLNASQKEAKRLGASIGAGGWALVVLEKAPPVRVLEKWIGESYRLMAGEKKT